VSRPRVVVLRGHSANVAELRAWEPLTDRYDLHVVTTSRADQRIDGLDVPWSTVATRRGLLPRGRLGTLATHALGDRYRGLEDLLRGADIVHSAELVPWFAVQPAALKRALGFELVLTVWETIPFAEAYRSARAREARRLTLAETDLFLPTTERAARALELEGVPATRLLVAPPGIDTARFAAAAARAPAAVEHVVVSPGRLVWEKGHQDVVRALARIPGVRLRVVGSGPERNRLLQHAAELGLADRVQIGAVPYDEMPDVFATASAVVLASLPTPSWEEQFGMVLAEAMAAGAHVVASSSGAIPEVLAGSQAALFAPGDWIGLARLLADGPLAAPPGARVAHPPDLVGRYSLEAAAERLDAAYQRALGGA
jgi:glycosyltransferase involved in cell wall biosynthesis